MNRIRKYSLLLVARNLANRRLLSTDSAKLAPILTMLEVRKNLMNLIGYNASWGENSIDKSSLINHVPKSQSELSKQRMFDSYAEAIIPLGDQPELRNKYSNFQKTVRFGRLLEDLDTMAVHIAYLHNKSQNVEINGHTLSPIVIVTALVDRIQVNSDVKIEMNKNIKISGFTSWVGKSSAEVTMKLEQEIACNAWLPVLEAKFLVCARDTANKGAGFMCPIEIGDDREKAIFELGEKKMQIMSILKIENKLIRQNENKNALFNVPPNTYESLLIHEMFKKTIDLKSSSLKQRIKPANSVWLEDTLLKNVVICFPEQRNLYDKIFGGYLMRKAFELAWINSCMYCKTTPKISVVDDISFRRPVLIGSLLFLTSQIVYTQENQMQVKVHAMTVDPVTSVKEITNDFYFKFTVPPHIDLPQVMPKTYAESMMYIDGMRHM